MVKKYNDIIIHEFKRLLKFYQYHIDAAPSKVHKNMYSFKYKSTSNVISILEKITFPITSSEQLKNIHGIGKNSIKRIDEIIQNGKLDIDENIFGSQQNSALLDELENIYGIGHARAIELVNKYGVGSINDLKERIDNGEIIVSETIAKGIKYYGIIKLHIPRSEIDDIYIYLADKLLSIDPELFGTVCGSYRRLKMFSNDIDFLVIDSSHQNFEAQRHKFETFIQSIIDDGFIIDYFTKKSSSKFMAICRLSPNHDVRRIDIRFVGYHYYYYSLLYFTGSKDFNRKMRQIALDNNMSLNEYGMTTVNNLYHDALKEKDIFDYLSMEYVQPDQR